MRAAAATIAGSRAIATAGNRRSGTRARNKTWNDVENDLRTGWNRVEYKTETTWEQIKDAVRDGWDRMMGRR